MKKLRIFLGIIIAVVLMYLLLRQIDPIEAVRVLAQSNKVLLLSAFILYIFINVLRALRYKLLIRKDIPLFDMVKMVFIHSFFLNILPLRTGELSLIFQLKESKVRVTKGISSLAIVRIFDFFAYASVFIVVAVFSSDLPRIFSVKVAAVITGLVLLSFIIFVLYAKRILHFFRFVFIGNYLQFLYSKIVEITYDITEIKSARMMLSLISLSLANAGLVVLLFVLVVNSLNLGIPYYVTMLTGVVLIIANAFPIQGFAAFGTTEGIWAMTMIYFGVEKEKAVIAALNSHIISLVFIILLAGYVFIDRMHTHRLSS